MRTSLLVYTVCCLLVATCSAQLRFPSLSSTLSNLAGFGSGSSGQSTSGQSSGQSAYSGFVRDYGRNLMAAMSSIYPTLFKPPQAQQQAQATPVAQPSFEQAFGSQFGQNLYQSQSAPATFSFGGAQYSLSPSLPSFSQLSAPFTSSFASAINQQAAPSFAPLSSSSFLNSQQAAGAPPSFGSPSVPSSYNPAASLDSPTNVRQLPGQPQAAPSFGPPQSSQSLLSQTSNSISSFAPFNQQDSQPSPFANHFNQQNQGGPIAASSILRPVQHNPNSKSHFINQQQLQQQQPTQFAIQPQQQYRPELMSIPSPAAIQSSNSFYKQ